MSTTRSYRSVLRAEQAEETRSRIRHCARALFESQGIADTTVAQIAAEAGVATPTIYGIFRNKAGLVRALLDDLEKASDIDAWMAAIREEEDSRRQLGRFVAWNRSLFELGSPILRSVLAARGAPDVAAMADEGDERRLSSSREFVEVWAARRSLLAGLTVDHAAEQLWLLTSPEQYLLAVDRLGWTPDRYEQWLIEVLEHALFGVETGEGDAWASPP